MTLPPLWPDLRHRSEASEQMDNPDGDLPRLHRTLAHFGLVNRLLTRVRPLLVKHIVAEMRQDPSRDYHLVDLGAGACDIPVWLLAYCRKRGLRLRVTACDHDPRVVAYARQRYGHVAGLTIVEQDVMKLNGLGTIDFIFGSHLLHHLTNRQITELLRMLPETGAHVILLNDIARCRWAYIGFTLLAGVLAHHSYTYRDGLLSIRKGFCRDELETHITASGARGYHVRPVFPARLVVWRNRSSSRQR